MKNVFFLVLWLTLLCRSVDAADWAQWHGPKRDNLSTAKKLLKQWPPSGPTLLWSVDGLGKGYSTIAKADDSIYITGMVGKQGILSRIDLKGNLIWQKPYAPEWYNSLPGSRSTATIHNGFAYVMGGLGDVVCLDAKTGQVKWSVNTFEKFSGKLPTWGFAESLLIDKEKIFCMAGGANASIVALDKNTGEVL